ncbi:MAG: iron-containing alcohol dehydrogenase [Spirochaetales bacterium]|nr:iron-containing alcohol dehydrogenase [Spirochaetales bacterium]
MADFRLRIGAEIQLGPDSILKLPLLLGDKSERVLLVVDPALSESRAVARARALFEERGLKAIAWDEGGARATSARAEECLALARGSRPKAVIGIGGVRTLSLARVAAALSNGGRTIDQLMDGAPPDKEGIPFIAVPTSYRDPFLLSELAVLADARDGSARLVHAPCARGSAAILDPNVMEGLSAKLAASCVLDALMHAVEGYVSARSDFFSDLVLERAAVSLVAALDAIIARPDDPAVRQEAVQGGLLSSLGLASSSAGLGTAVAFAINARFGVPKSSLAAVLLPWTLENAARGRLEKVAALASAFGDCDAEAPAAERADAAVEGLRMRLGKLKIPSRLKDFDLQLDRLVETAANARALDFVNYLPRLVSTDDVFDFIKAAY